MGQTYVCVDNVWRPCSSSIVNIKYISSYGTVPPQEITLSSIAVTMPSCGTRIGYDFLGWSTINGSSTAEYTTGNTYYFSKNTTLYAVWKVQTFTLTYYEVSSTTPGSSNTYNYGMVKLKDPYTGVETGVVPLGWTDDPSSTVVKYSIGSSILMNSNKSLHAIYRKTVYGGFRINGTKYGVSYTIPSSYAGYPIESIAIRQIFDVFSEGTNYTYTAVIDGKSYNSSNSGFFYNVPIGVGSTISITPDSITSINDNTSLVFSIDFDITSSKNDLYYNPSIIVIPGY
jgi:hypothetical protein